MDVHAAQSFGRNLARFAAERGVKQSHLAAASGLNRSSLSRVFTGQQEPKVGVAAGLARAVGVSLDVLLDGEPAGVTRLVPLTAEERDLMMVARRLGIGAALDRLLGVISRPPEHAARRLSG